MKINRGLILFKRNTNLKLQKFKQTFKSEFKEIFSEFLFFCESNRFKWTKLFIWTLVLNIFTIKWIREVYKKEQTLFLTPIRTMDYLNNYETDNVKLSPELKNNYDRLKYSLLINYY